MFNLFNKSPNAQQQILFFCGAGLSAESGLKTFRDKDGLWNNHKLDDVCNIKTFVKNKELVFDFYNNRKTEILNAKPNAAHFKIAEIQKKYGAENVHIFTSNIDNLLSIAGCKNICHVHGDISSMRCIDCDHSWSIGNKPYDMKELCPNCKSSSIKPSIIFFNEHAPKYRELRQAFEKTGPVIKNQITYNIKIIVGTSFKVIQPDIFMPSRGRSIIVDKNLPELGSFENKFEQIIIEPATSGMGKAAELISKWYIKN